MNDLREIYRCSCGQRYDEHDKAKCNTKSIMDLIIIEEEEARKVFYNELIERLKEDIDIRSKQQKK